MPDRSPAPALSPPPSLASFVAGNVPDAEFIDPGAAMPTVALAAAAVGVAPEAIVKTVVFHDGRGNHAVAIAAGTAKINRRALSQALGLGALKLADPDAVLAATGYRAGGVPPIGHRLRLPTAIDSRVMALPVVYGGGGDERLLLRIAPTDLLRLTDAVVADIVSPPR